MTLDDAIKLLTEKYKIAQKREFIAKPLSWALYHTWDEVDKKDKGVFRMSRWIPVSERLPEETGKCIVTAFDGFKSRSTYADFQKTVGNFILTGRRSAWRVTAWMPMPEPYEAGGKK